MLKRMMLKKKNEKGFTLIELVMVIVILGILAAVAIPTYINLSSDAQNATARGVLGSLRSANAIILAQRAVGGTVTAWDMTAVVAAAQVQGVTMGTPAASGSVTAIVGSSTFTFTLNPAGPTIGAPATIVANVATW